MIRANSANPVPALQMLSAEQLEAEIARLEREIDRLADAVWPAAARARIDTLAALDRVRAEAQRRRARGEMVRRLAKRLGVAVAVVEVSR